MKTKIILLICILTIAGCNHYTARYVKIDNKLCVNLTGSAGKGYDNIYTICTPDANPNGIYTAEQVKISRKIIGGMKDFPDKVLTPIGYIFFDNINGKIQVAFAEKGTRPSYDNALPINGIYGLGKAP